MVPAKKRRYSGKEKGPQRELAPTGRSGVGEGELSLADEEGSAWRKDTCLLVSDSARTASRAAIEEAEGRAARADYGWPSSTLRGEYPLGAPVSSAAGLLARHDVVGDVADDAGAGHDGGGAEDCDASEGEGGGQAEEAAEGAQDDGAELGADAEVE